MTPVLAREVLQLRSLDSLDVLTQIRRALWQQLGLGMSADHIDEQKSSTDLFAHFGEILACAA